MPAPENAATNESNLEEEMAPQNRAPRLLCPLSGCDWAVSTGKPTDRQQWANVHLSLAEELARHLRDDHDATGA